MEEKAKGKYERVSEEKYDDFLKALGVNFMLRKAATVSTPVMEVSELGGVWSIKTLRTKFLRNNTAIAQYNKRKLLPLIICLYDFV